MAVLKMERQAADNTYLHKDFHKALNHALIYLENRFGEEAVRDYLHDFSAAYFAPLAADLKKRGLMALQEHFQRIYDLEGGDATIEILSDPERLLITVRSCPAVAHIRAAGDPVSPLFHLTSFVVNETICAGSCYQAALSDYDPGTGACCQTFSRREAK